ncbi:MAG: phosphoribosylformylglycinamidine cyclo-ligase [Gammaproteobacteria bacterium]|nr:phosphoribosylformylglycinamidine cyclo-ligase [Gammaproteobacteria bacterium]
MTDTISPKGLTYKDAGVNIDAGNELVAQIKPFVKRTHRSGVLGGLGGFGGLFELPAGYQKPVLVSGTDGVGTKLRLAIDLQRPDSVGIDLVAMCVNDIIVTGAEPLWFLDYFATARLDVDQASKVIEGIAKGCELAGAALLGGETAEMPNMYHDGDYDLAGFAVGIVEKEHIIDGSAVSAGDVLIGLSASGLHSNGYSLVNKLRTSANLESPCGETTLADALLMPTRIYVKALLAMLSVVTPKAMAHITGGGLTENLPRVLPDNCLAEIQLDSWTRPAVVDWVQHAGNIEDSEMLRTFNCGIGMVIVVAPEQAEPALNVLASAGEEAQVIGSISHSAGPAIVEYL